MPRRGKKGVSDAFLKPRGFACGEAAFPEAFHCFRKLPLRFGCIAGTLLLRGLGNGTEEVGDVHGNGGGEISRARTAFFVKGDARNVGGGLAGHIGGERSSLLIPFLADAGVGLHAVAFLQLVLGLYGCGDVGRDGAGGVKVDLRLARIEHAAGDDALVVEGESGVDGVNLYEASSVRGGVLGAADAGDGAEAELIGRGSAKLGCGVDGLFNGNDEVVHMNGNGGGEVGSGRAAFLVKGDALHFVKGLADDVGSKRGSLLIPFLADAGGGEHAVARAKLVLGLVLGVKRGGDGAGGVEVDLRLGSVDHAGNDFARGINRYAGDDGIALGQAGSIRSSVLGARNRGNDTKTSLYSLSSRGTTAREQGGHQHGSHNQSKKFLHGFLLDF